jgi:hypothetical protein
MVQALRQSVMTPEQKQVLQEHVHAIAKILYADCDPESLQTLADVETTVRNKMLEHVSPEVGFFYKQQNHNQRGQGNNGDARTFHFLALAIVERSGCLARS